jgi:hypothetical protein
MRTCKIIVVGAVLRAALIVTIAVTSNGFESGRTIADHATNSHQQQISLVDPVTPPEKTDIGQTPNTEPWGPFRTTDW